MHPDVAAEAALSDSVRDFVRRHNGRRRRPRAGDAWVRVRPHDAEEVRHAVQDPRFMKFASVGAQARIVEIVAESGSPYMDVECGGDRMLWAEEEFLGTFIRIIDGRQWDPPRPS